MQLDHLALHLVDKNRNCSIAGLVLVLDKQGNHLVDVLDEGESLGSCLVEDACKGVVWVRDDLAESLLDHVELVDDLVAHLWLL